MKLGSLSECIKLMNLWKITIIQFYTLSEIYSFESIKLLAVLFSPSQLHYNI